MSDGTLYIGHRRYSSWSLRGWLLCQLAGLLNVNRIVRENGMPKLAQSSKCKASTLARVKPIGSIHRID